MSEGSTAVRRPRRDVARNLDALLAAARDVFAAEGVHAPAKQITDRAGVGVGTLYRHFPQRSDLIVAVMTHEVDACVQAAAELSASREPWPALTAWVDRWIDFVATKQGLAEALHSDDPAYRGLPQALLHTVEPAVAELLARGRTDGSIRTDVSAYELILAISLLSVTIPGRDPDWNRRLVLVFVDGLRGQDGAPGTPNH